MPNLVLFDDEKRDNFLPLVYTRPVALLRLGIWTIKEKWERLFNMSASILTEEYLSEKFPLHIADDNLLINGRYLPNEYLISLIRDLSQNEAILSNGELVAVRLSSQRLSSVVDDEDIDSLDGIEIDRSLLRAIDHTWDLFLHNSVEIENDFSQLKRKDKSQSVSPTNRIIGDKELLFLEEGVTMEYATINLTNGPVYIGKDATVMEGSMLRGPVAVLNNAVIKMGAKIYGACTFGPYSKVGGEVSQSLIIGYSNKGHDGYLGNSILGEWCNLGADTNTSNLKNNYGSVRVWDYSHKKFIDSGQQFCGLILGDHSKTGINTMLNTGTVAGVCCNIFGGGFPRTFIPSFSWGGSSGYSTNLLEKAYETAKIVMARRNQEFDELNQRILEHVFNVSSDFRTWEK